MAGSRFVTRPWWRRTSARALRSDRSDLNWAIATTLRCGCFLASLTSRVWADGGPAWATDPLAAIGTTAASRTAMVRPRQRLFVKLNKI